MAGHDRQQAKDVKPQRTWQDIEHEIEQEPDVKKMLKLTAELNNALLEEERRKVLQRLGRIPPAA
ncbi:MAG: hypothetical protein DMG80_17255 [Acidobacteria bacterium]|nr:MAG: hypothetical protein DMG80_17255 [Acidobacteriota bacterium]